MPTLNFDAIGPEIKSRWCNYVLLQAPWFEGYVQPFVPGYLVERTFHTYILLSIVGIFTLHRYINTKKCVSNKYKTIRRINEHWRISKPASGSPRLLMSACSLTAYIIVSVSLIVLLHSLMEELNT